MEQQIPKPQTSKRKGLELILSEEECWNRMFDSRDIHEHIAYDYYKEITNGNVEHLTEEQVKRNVFDSYKEGKNISVYRNISILPNGKVKITFDEDVVKGEHFDYVKIVSEHDAWEEIMDDEEFFIEVRYRMVRYLQLELPLENVLKYVQERWQIHGIDHYKNYHLRKDGRVEIKQTH